MHASQAAMRKAGGGSGGGLQPGSTAMASKARVERRDSRRGGGEELMKAEQEEHLAPPTADEVTKGIDGPGVVVLGGEEQLAAQGGGGENGGAELKLLNLKLKNQTDESAWLRSRVNDLETMVKTMRVAIEGSLEEGAGEKNFPGWRQVYAVQYPWLRDRKREDPARYTYMKGNRNGGRAMVGE